jgi:hypothetical protein
VADTPYTRDKQVRRNFKDRQQPSLSEVAIPGDDDFVDPYRSSNSVLGYDEAGPVNRPADYKPKARIDVLSPNSGLAAAGGTVITVTGRYFTGTTAVKFGGTNGSALQVLNDTTLKVTTPAKAAGSYAVDVVNPGGTTTKANAATFV